MPISTAARTWLNGLIQTYIPNYNTAIINQMIDDPSITSYLADLYQRRDANDYLTNVSIFNSIIENLSRKHYVPSDITNFVLALKKSNNLNPANQDPSTFGKNAQEGQYVTGPNGQVYRVHEVGGVRYLQLPADYGKSKSGAYWLNNGTWDSNPPPNSGGGTGGGGAGGLTPDMSTWSDEQLAAWLTQQAGMGDTSAADQTEYINWLREQMLYGNPEQRWYWEQQLNLALAELKQQSAMDVYDRQFEKNKWLAEQAKAPLDIIPYLYGLRREEAPEWYQQNYNYNLDPATAQPWGTPPTIEPYVAPGGSTPAPVGWANGIVDPTQNDYATIRAAYPNMTEEEINRYFAPISQAQREAFQEMEANETPDYRTSPYWTQLLGLNTQQPSTQQGNQSVIRLSGGSSHTLTPHGSNVEAGPSAVSNPWTQRILAGYGGWGRQGNAMLPPGMTEADLVNYNITPENEALWASRGYIANDAAAVPWTNYNYANVPVNGQYQNWNSPMGIPGRYTGDQSAFNAAASAVGSPDLLNSLSPELRARILSGTMPASTVSSILGYAGVKSGNVSAYDYGGGARAFPQGRTAIESASQAYQNSPTTQLQRQVVAMNKAAGAGGQKYMVSGGKVVPRDY